MSAPKYDRRKFGWLDRVMFDTTLSLAVRMVAYGIYRHLNDVTGDAWPSQATLSRKLGPDIRTVRQAVRTLRTRGYLEVEFDPKSRSNTYKPIYEVSDLSTISAPVIGTSRPSSVGTSRPSSA